MIKLSCSWFSSQWLLLAVFLPSLCMPCSARGDDFARSGIPLLEKYCVGCHGGPRPKADLSFAKFKTTASLLAERKVWQRVLDVVRDGEMPPVGKPQPSAEERDAFLKLINGIFDAADQQAQPSPGRVTVRRLNRAEYNNTIRDLVGIDSSPAEDFPSDDVGHGFDNIGDVLTLPPVLMERYLAAAEAIMNTAILVNPPKPPGRGIGGQYLQPASPNPPLKNNQRILTYKPDAPPLVNGPVFTTYENLDPDNEYIFKARVTVESGGKKPVRVALWVNCSPGTVGEASDSQLATLSGAAVSQLKPLVILKTFELTSRNKPELLEAKVPAHVRFSKAGVALLTPEEGEPPPTLLIQGLYLDGPLDTRPATQRKLLACDPSKPRREQTQEVLERFASRAFRRPATPDEVDRLVRLAETVESSRGKWEAGIQQAMTAVLCSPKFLFRLELDDQPLSAEPRPLDDYALASRLSYFLWSSMPDEELFALAARKELSANLEAQVKRMLADPKASALVDNFVMQWLQLRPLRNAQPDATTFPSFNEPLRAAMFEETRRFFLEILREDRSVLDIIDADFTYLNSTLARHYGIVDTAGNRTSQGKNRKPGGKPITRPNEWLRVNVAGTERGGILTQASMLTVTSNPTRTSPVKRGRWVLEQLLGTPPPPPPPDVPELEKDGKPITAGSLRQRMEEHRKNPACANCHAKMDPLGFGLENFDAVGAFRTKDGPYPIDASGELPGGLSFNGPAELKKILLAKKDLFTRCLAEKMLTFAIGRGIEYYDKRAIDRIVEQTSQNGYRFSALVTAIVKSDPFRMRPGKDQ